MCRYSWVLAPGFILPLNLIPGIFKNVTVFGYPPLCSQSRIQVQGKGPRNIYKFITCNRDWWEGVWERSNLPQKCSQVLSETKFGSPNQEFLDLPLLNVGLLQQFEDLSFFNYLQVVVSYNVPLKYVLHPSSHLICILFCPIISKRNVMNIVILAQIPHHIIMSSKQVLHVTMETPMSVRRI